MLIKHRKLAVSLSLLVWLLAFAWLSPLRSLADGAQVNTDYSTTTDCTGTDCVTNAIKAADPGGNGTITLGAGFGFGSLTQALNTIISLIFLIAGLAAFVYILLGAFNYLTAGDDSAKTEKARKMITNAVVGLLLVALVYVIWIVAINLVPGLHDFFNATNG